MVKNSVVVTVFSLLAASLVAWTPIAGADDPKDCDQLPPDQVQQCQQKKAAGIVDDALNQAGRAGNGQQPANDPDRNRGLTGGGWMTVNGVLTCVPNGAVFSHNERVESVLPPNGDPRC
jgi:hypothetical protein